MQKLAQSPILKNQNRSCLHLYYTRLYLLFTARELYLFVKKTARNNLAERYNLLLM